MTARDSASFAKGVTALFGVTLVWAFSFGLIGRFLSGLDPLFVAAVRLLLAALCFLPFLRLRGISPAEGTGLAILGAVQFGVMYIGYLSAFRYLEAWQVALFSVLTPLWIAAIDGILRREWRPRVFAAAVLSVAGAAVIRADGVPAGDFWTGFLLMQIANLAFGGGQVWFRRWKLRNPDRRERDVFGLLYLGALALALAVSLPAGAFSGTIPLSAAQVLALGFLGLVASGLGFFFWNYGASRVPVGFLAAANNLVVPLGVALAIVLNRSEPAWSSLAIGSALIAAGVAAGARRARNR